MFDYKNFSFPGFIDYVLKKMKLENSPEEIKEKLSQEIAIALGDRIITAIFEAMTDENYKVYDRIRAQEPDLSSLEAVLFMIDEIPVLHEILVKNVNDLAEELTFNSERVEKALGKSKEKLKK
jgi:hypothetical protein